MKVIPPDISVEMNCAGSYYFPDVYRALFGLPPLKWWQRLYAWLRWGRKIRKAEFAAARGLSKTRLTFRRHYGFDPFDIWEEGQNDEEET